MARLGIDPDKFKHVSSDDHKTVLRHKDGHELTIAHNKLTPKMRDQLKALSTSKEPMPEEPKKFAMGGMEENADDQYRPPAIEMPPEGTTLADTVQIPATEGATIQQATPAPGMEQTAPMTPSPSSVQQPSSTDPGLAPTPDEQQQAASLTPQAPTPETGLDLMQKGMKGAMGANTAEAKAIDTKSKADLTAYQGQQQALTDLKTTNEKAQQEIQGRIDASRQAVADAKINPEQYWTGDKDGNGSHSRWLSAIGMILAGFDPAGRPNMAVQMLHHQMDANIQAQKENLGTKKTLLEANMKELKDHKDAELMTRMQINDMTQNQLAQAAAKSQSPLAAAAAQKANSFLQMEQAKNFDALTSSLANKKLKEQLTSQNDAGPGARNEDPSAYVQHLVPKEHQKAVFDEIAAAQNTVHMANEIKKSFEDAAKENTVMKTGAGLLRTPGSVYALHQAMQPTFKDLEGTVRQAAMENTFKNITPAPGDSQHTIEQKREALMGYLQSKSSAPTAKGYGIDLSKFKSTNTSNDLNQPVKGADGRMYIKTTVNGKSGFVPVK